MEKDRNAHPNHGDQMSEIKTSDAAREFAILTATKRRFQRSLKAIDTQLAEIERDLIVQLDEDGIDRMTVDAGEDGSWTVSSSTLTWAKLREGAQARALEVLKDTDLEHLLTINSTKLSGLYREHEKDAVPGGLLTDEFVELLDVVHRTRVSARKA